MSKEGKLEYSKRIQFMPRIENHNVLESFQKRYLALDTSYRRKTMSDKETVHKYVDEITKKFDALERRR